MKLSKQKYEITINKTQKTQTNPFISTLSRPQTSNVDDNDGNHTVDTLVKITIPSHHVLLRDRYLGLEVMDDLALLDT